MSKACKDELNAQLQALNARVKQVEENAAAALTMQMWNFMTTVLKLVATGSTTAAGVAILTDPFAKYCVEMMTGGLNLGGIKQLYDLTQSMGAETMKEILLKLALENLDVPPYGSDLMNAVSGAINGAIAEADAGLQAAIAGAIPEEIAAATAKLNELNAQANSIVDMVTASNHISVCKIATSKLGL